MHERQNIASGSPWEEIVGYSRAVRVGYLIEVAGTTAVDEEGRTVGPGDPYEQARFIFRKIQSALAEAGAGLQDVVRTRMFVTDIGQWEAVGKAHGEVFKEVKPAATMVQVQALIRPELMVEIEVTAVLREYRGNNWDPGDGKNNE
jgi:enamine deaminase RidA (YjgF/YER057c/UK114 family)